MKDYSFGNHICALRMRAGLSQFQLGNLVGVSDKAVSKWENGDAKPRIATCYRLAEVLGVNINELLSCNTIMPARKELNIMKKNCGKRPGSGYPFMERIHPYYVGADLLQNKLRWKKRMQSLG